MSEKEQVSLAIDDIFSDADLYAAEKLYEQHTKTNFDNLAQVLHDEIVEPNIEIINWRLGADNDPVYLSECLEDALREMNGDPKSKARLI